MAPPEFDLPTRVATILTTVCVAIVYSPGLPVMHVIAFLGTATSLLVDKFLLFRVYAAPARFDDSLARLAATAVFVAVVLRTGVSVYMLGEPGGISSSSVEESIDSAVNAGGASNSTAADTVQSSISSSLATLRSDPLGIGERATLVTTFPLVAVLILMCVAWLLKRTLGNVLTRFFSTLVYWLTCFACCKSSVHIDDLDSYLPALSKQYSRMVGPIQVARLREQQRSDQSIAVRQCPYFPDSRYSEERIWSSDGYDAKGKFHQAGDPMLTWEVLRSKGSHSYRLGDAPRFADVLRLFAIVQGDSDDHDRLDRDFIEVPESG